MNAHHRANDIKLFVEVYHGKLEHLGSQPFSVLYGDVIYPRTIGPTGWCSPKYWSTEHAAACSIIRTPGVAAFVITAVIIGIGVGFVVP